MRTTIALLAFSTVALAACGQSGSDSSEPVQTVEPGKSAAEVAFQFQPGQYKTTIKIDKYEIPGVPAAALEQMKGVMGKPIEMTEEMERRRKEENAAAADQALVRIAEHLGETSGSTAGTAALAEAQKLNEETKVLAAKIAEDRAAIEALKKDGGKAA